MRTSLNPLMYKEWDFYKLYTQPGQYTLNLSPGTYQYTLRGSGGAGGSNDSQGNRKGGAGGKGDLSVGIFTIDNETTVIINVGDSGLTYANGGNGGVKGNTTDAPVDPGSGGGGGKPSYILNSTTYYIANGGGGGGGAGGSDTNNARYSDGGSGGGGGGYYRLGSYQNTTHAIEFWIDEEATDPLYQLTDVPQPDSGWYLDVTIPNGTTLNVGQRFEGSSMVWASVIITVEAISGTNITFRGNGYGGLLGNTDFGTITRDIMTSPIFGLENVPGQKGGTGTLIYQSGSVYSNTPGVAGNMDFPELYSGAGGAGNGSGGGVAGASGASGGGASGGGGGRGLGNDPSSRAGGGGGAAGGSPDAGGGQGGTGYRSGDNGLNHHTTPTSTAKENAEYGIVGNYGVGGGPNINGTSGFVYIRKLNTRKTVWDLGLITEAVTDTNDMGSVDDTVSSTIVMGTLQHVLV